METFILALVISGLSVAGLGIGVLLGRGPIKGSCGGLACHKGIACGVCKAKARKEN